MCKICVEWEAGKLTAKEAYRNIGEVVVKSNEEANHLFALSDRILEKEMGPSEQDEELNAAWHKEMRGD